MSAGALQNHMRLQALMAGGVNSQARSGEVTDYNPDLYAVKVLLKPNDIETGWLPIVTGMAGGGWGVSYGPGPGDQAIVVFLEGSVEAGVCVGFIYSDEDRPTGVPAGEIWLSHQSVASLKFTNDGMVSLVAPGGLLLKSDASISVTAENISVHGTTTIKADHVKVQADSIAVEGTTTITGNASVSGVLSVGSLKGA